MRVGVIGTGIMGENHVRVYSSLAEQCQLIGIYDNNFDRAQEMAEKYNVQKFDQLNSLLAQVDAVSIAVPTKFHYQVGMQCINHHVHMLMEKPIASTVSEAKRLIRSSTEKGVKLQVGHIELYNPAIMELENVLAQEKVIAVDVHRMSPFEPRHLHEDVVNDLMIHDIYILYHLLKDEILKFYSMGQIMDDTVKHAIVIARFTRGAIAQLTASYKTEEKVRTIRVITEDAFIQADLLKKNILISRSTNFFMNPWFINYHQQNIVEKVFVPHHEPLKMELSDFLAYVKHDKKPKATGEDGLTALTVTNKISEYIKQNDE